jgi:hypothetical protein
MPIEYGSGNKFAKLPIIGESREFHIVSAKKVEVAQSNFNFKKREKIVTPDGKEATIDVDQGYHYEYELDDGRTLSVGSWCPAIAFQQINVQDGDWIIVRHPEKGKWEVEKLAQEVKE